MSQSEIAIACQMCDRLKQQNLILIQRLKNTNAILEDYTKMIEKLKMDKQKVDQNVKIVQKLKKIKDFLTQLKQEL